MPLPTTAQRPAPLPGRLHQAVLRATTERRAAPSVTYRRDVTWCNTSLESRISVQGHAVLGAPSTVQAAQHLWGCLALRLLIGLQECDTPASPVTRGARRHPRGSEVIMDSLGYLMLP